MVDRYSLQQVAALVLGVLIGAYGLCIFEQKAHANPKPGLWQEESTMANGVTIQKIRDTTGGDYNVCYVASHISDTNGQWAKNTPTVSISCVPERKP